MLSTKFLILALSAVAFALPIRREVPQEHSHEPILTSVRASLLVSNPDNIGDVVFGLLGNAAAAQGQGKIADPDCLQQATADQAFTNAKAANDIPGMTNALIFQALERNTGKVGLASVKCTSLKATNPEIAAIERHQDPASAGAAAINKASTLALAKQIAAIGGDPQDALKAGTFEAGDVNDNTGKGNTCDDANDAAGCIFSQNLIVPDATAEEITAAVGGAGAAAGNNNGKGNNNDNTNPDSTKTGTETCAPPTTVTVTVAAGAATAAPPPPPAGNQAAAAGSNLQTFTGTLGGAAAPAVTAGGRGFVVEGSDDFLNVGAALGRSCDIQKNKCANVANNGAKTIAVSDCDKQNQACRAAIKA